MKLDEIAAKILHYQLLEKLGENFETVIFKDVSKQHTNDFYMLKLFKNSLC
jgi:hypothetical protein